MRARAPRVDRQRGDALEKPSEKPARGPRRRNSTLQEAAVPLALSYLTHGTTCKQPSSSLSANAL
jgi:hypothetical protein